MLPPPVLAVKVKAQSIPREIVPQTTREGAGAPLFFSRESHIIYLRVVLRLTDRQTITVYFRFCTVHVTTV